MAMENIYKTEKGFLSLLRLGAARKKIVLTISDGGINYNSTLGDLGFIGKEFIQSIAIGKIGGVEIIKIKLEDSYALTDKLSAFKRKLTERYKKETGADILFFQQDLDEDLPKVFALIEQILKK